MAKRYELPDAAWELIKVSIRIGSDTNSHA